MVSFAELISIILKLSWEYSTSWDMNKTDSNMFQKFYCFLKTTHLPYLCNCNSLSQKDFDMAISWS